MKNFGVGQLVINPGGTTPTPVQVGILQEVTLDISYTEKELYGAYQFPVDVARAEAKFTAKAKTGQLSASLMNSFLTGSTSAAGYTAGAINEAGTIPPTPGPYTITVTNSATWVIDNGVINLATGKVMTRVASAPATGQYSVTAGVYTFAAADQTNAVWISYTYTVPTTGATVHLNNQLMGTGTAYQLYLFNIYKTVAVGVKLYSVTLPKLSIPMKNVDFTVSDLEMAIYADATNNVMEYYESDF